MNLRFLFALPVAALAAACTSSSTLETTGASASAISSCHTTASSMCARIESCSPPAVRYLFGTRSDCEARLFTVCRQRYEGAGANDHPAACDVAAIQCEELEDVLGLGGDGTRLMARCAVSPGSGRDGTPCLRDGDCEGMVCHASGVGGRCGTCMHLPSAGESCDSACTPPYECIGGKCGRRTPAGASCADTTSRCAGDDFSTKCRGGVCVKLGQLHDPCTLDPSMQCDYGAGLSCDDATKTCEPFAFSGPGEPCDGVTVDFSHPGKRTCDATSVCVNGTCVERAGVGGRCASAADCRAHLACSGGACTPSPVPASSCTP